VRVGGLGAYLFVEVMDETKRPQCDILGLFKMAS
jgi:hypothetical protein